MYTVVGAKKHQKGRAKRQLVETMHSAQMVRRRITHGENTAEQREIRKMLGSHARTLFNSINAGRRAQGLKPMTWKEIIFLLRQRSDRMAKKNNFNK